MTRVQRTEPTRQKLDTIAWRFLGSEFTGQFYSSWPIDRRIEAYLLHHGPAAVMQDGSFYNALMECVMANIGPALRSGVLSQEQTQQPRHPREGS